MESDYLILRRASAFRPSGERNDDDYDVLCNGVVVGRIMQAAAHAVMPHGRAPPSNRRIFNGDRRCSVRVFLFLDFDFRDGACFPGSAGE